MSSSQPGKGTTPSGRPDTVLPVIVALLLLGVMATVFGEVAGEDDGDDGNGLDETCMGLTCCGLIMLVIVILFVRSGSKNKSRYMNPPGRTPQTMGPPGRTPQTMNPPGRTPQTMNPPGRTPQTMNPPGRTPQNLQPSNRMLPGRMPPPAMQTGRPPSNVMPPPRMGTQSNFSSPGGPYPPRPGAPGQPANPYQAIRRYFQPSKVPSETDADIRILRETESIRGYIRMKIAVQNQLKSVITGVELDLKYDEKIFRLDKIEPDYNMSGSKVKIGVISTGEKKTVAFYLDPQICTTTAIDGIVSYKDHKGKLKTVTMRPKDVNVICPIYFTQETANTAMLKNLVSNILKNQDSKLYSIPKGMLPVDAFETVKSAVSGRSIQFVREFCQPMPFVSEAWYYGVTKVKKLQTVIKASVDGEKNTIQLFAATSNEDTLTGLLAELGHDLTTRLKEKGLPAVQITNVTIKDSVLHKTALLFDDPGTGSSNVCVEDSIIHKSSLPFGEAGFPDTIESPGHGFTTPGGMTLPAGSSSFDDSVSHDDASPFGKSVSHDDAGSFGKSVSHDDAGPFGKSVSHDDAGPFGESVSHDDAGSFGKSVSPDDAGSFGKSVSPDGAGVSFEESISPDELVPLDEPMAPVGSEQFDELVPIDDQPGIDLSVNYEALSSMDKPKPPGWQIKSDIKDSIGEPEPLDSHISSDELIPIEEPVAPPGANAPAKFVSPAIPELPPPTAPPARTDFTSESVYSNVPDKPKPPPKPVIPARPEPPSEPESSGDSPPEKDGKYKIITCDHCGREFEISPDWVQWIQCTCGRRFNPMRKRKGREKKDTQKKTVKKIVRKVVRKVQRK